MIATNLQVKMQNGDHNPSDLLLVEAIAEDYERKIHYSRGVLHPYNSEIFKGLLMYGINAHELKDFSLMNKESEKYFRRDVKERIYRSLSYEYFNPSKV